VIIQIKFLKGKLNMKEIILSLITGLLIGVIFRLIKLPVPVPHGIGGIVGLIGMFIGSEVVGYITRAASSK
jgi:XapX domain-containing protein